MEADKHVYCWSMEGDFINWNNERLMHLELEDNIIDIVTEWRLINMFAVAVWRVE
jgi:hypothetical protein